MSAFYRCDYCGRECSSGSGVADLRMSVAPIAVDKKWAKDHSTHRSSRVRVLIGLDGIAPEHTSGHDLCDGCLAIHLRDVLAYLGGSQ